MMTMESTLGIGHAARLLGITVKTLQRWEREGRLVPAARTASNRRRYTESQLRAFLHLPSDAPGAPRRIVAYCRVSSAAQRPDLANQRHTLEQFTAARGLAGVEFIEEVGGGLNFGRKRFVALMDAIGRDEVATLVLAHRDRLTRFGFDWFAHHAALHGCELLVLNQEHLSPEQEMVQDLMTIVHCFSSRLYGLRNYRRQLRASLENHHAAGAPDQDSAHA
jgi:predicted site-specific integrase-resolvase